MSLTSVVFLKSDKWSVRLWGDMLVFSPVSLLMFLKVHERVSGPSGCSEVTLATICYCCPDPCESLSAPSTRIEHIGRLVRPVRTDSSSIRQPQIKKGLKSLSKSGVIQFWFLIGWQQKPAAPFTYLNTNTRKTSRPQRTESLWTSFQYSPVTWCFLFLRSFVVYIKRSICLLRPVMCMFALFIYFHVNLICTFMAINVLCATAPCKRDAFNKYKLPSAFFAFSDAFCYTHIMICLTYTIVIM